MKHFAERLNVSELERGHGTETARLLLREWNEHKGRLPENLPTTEWASDKLLILGKPTSEFKAPKLLVCGEFSLAAIKFDDSYSENPENSLAVVSDEYQRLVAVGHYCASENCTPVYDHISTEYGGKALRYERLLLPYKTSNGNYFH